MNRRHFLAAIPTAFLLPHLKAETRDRLAIDVGDDVLRPSGVLP